MTSFAVVNFSHLIGLQLDLVARSDVPRIPEGFLKDPEGSMQNLNLKGSQTIKVFGSVIF